MNIFSIIAQGLSKGFTSMHGIMHCVLWPNVVQLLFADLLSTKLHVK